MFALALHLRETREQRLPWKPTPSESVEVFRALERYARGGLDGRLQAANDMDQIITRVVLRACDEIGKVGTK